MLKETDARPSWQGVPRPSAEIDDEVKRLPDDTPLNRPERRRFVRPPKQSVTIRLDSDVVAWFKAQTVDCGYQTAINRALREYMNQHS